MDMADKNSCLREVYIRVNFSSLPSRAALTYTHTGGIKQTLRPPPGILGQDGGVEGRALTSSCESTDQNDN